MNLVRKSNSHYKAILTLDDNDNVLSFKLESGNNSITLMENLGLILGNIERNGSENQEKVLFKHFENPANLENEDLVFEFLSMHDVLDAKLVITIIGEYIYFECNIDVTKKLKSNYLRFDIKHQLNQPFDFVWTPHLQPEKENLVGEHKLWTPIVLVAKSGQNIALIPEIGGTTLYDKIRLHLDIDHLEDSRISYGFRNHSIRNHIMFVSKRSNKITFKVKSDINYKLKFALRLADGESKQEFLHKTMEKVWKNDQNMMVQNLYNQHVPLKILSKYSYNRLIDAEVYNAYRKFDYKGLSCGGLIYRLWTGKSRGKYETIKSDEIDNMIENPQYNSKIFRILQERLLNSPFLTHIIGKGAQKINPHNIEWFWNQSWFMNIRTAIGLHQLGLICGKKEFCNIADTIANLLLSAPLNDGLFPSVAVITDNGVEWLEGMVGFTPIRDYNLVDIALASHWLFKYSELFNYQIARVMERITKVTDKIISLQNTDGSFPTIIPSRSNKSALLPSGIEILERSAGSAAIGRLLVLMYGKTKNDTYLRSARKLGEFLKQEVMPHNKWYDYETFFSCTQYLTRFDPGNLKDPYSGVYPQNNLSIYWAVDFFKNLFQTTSHEPDLQSGIYLLDYLSLFQQIWDPPFLSVNLFGGFGCQNTDAEWSDTRQALFACEFLDFYLITHRSEYLERAIAALRASFVLLTHEGNKKLAPGNFRWIMEDDYGILMENYGHQGFDVPVPGIVTPDWGTGTAVYAYTYFRNKIGDLYLNLDYQHYYGVDGCTVRNSQLIDNELVLTIDVLEGLDVLKIVIENSADQSISKILLKNRQKRVISSISVKKTRQILEISLKESV